MFVFFLVVLLNHSGGFSDVRGTRSSNFFTKLINCRGPRENDYVFNCYYHLTMFMMSHPKTPSDVSVSWILSKGCLVREVRDWASFRSIQLVPSFSPLFGIHIVIIQCPTLSLSNLSIFPSTNVYRKIYCNSSYLK